MKTLVADNIASTGTYPTMNKNSGTVVDSVADRLKTGLAR